MVIRAVTLGFLLTILPIAQQAQTRLKNAETERKAVKTRKVMGIVDKLERLARINDNEGNGKHTQGAGATQTITWHRRTCVRRVHRTHRKPAQTEIIISK
jgi:hypothetical protein